MVVVVEEVVVRLVWLERKVVTVLFVGGERDCDDVVGA